MNLRLCQDCVVPGLLTRHDTPRVALEGSNHTRQAERHTSVAVRRTFAAPNTQRPQALLRCSSVEPWYVDADAQLTTLAWVGSNARWVAVAAYCSCFLKLLSGLDDELLSTGRTSPGALLRVTCCEAHLHVVPERLPRDVGNV